MFSCKETCSELDAARVIADRLGTAAPDRSHRQTEQGAWGGLATKKNLAVKIEAVKYNERKKEKLPFTLQQVPGADNSIAI